MSAITSQFGRRHLTVSVARMPAFLWPGSEQYSVHLPLVSVPRHSATAPGRVSGTAAGARDERALPAAPPPRAPAPGGAPGPAAGARDGRALPAATSLRSCGSSPRIASWTIAGPGLTVVRESVNRNSVASTRTREGAAIDACGVGA